MSKYTNFSSLKELREIALETKINFFHKLSEFTLEKLDEQTKEFFKEDGQLIDSEGNPGPNVELHNNFAIDTVSSLGDSKAGPVRFGQNLNTKKFVAFKPISKIEAVDSSSEVNIAKKLGNFQEIIEHNENPDLVFVAMDLIDGVTFKDIKQISSKINEATRYLICFNLVKEFKVFQDHHLMQEDKNFGNFMIDVRDFGVKIIDAERCIIHNDNNPFIKVAGLFDCIFSNHAPRDEQYHGKMNAYVKGTFESFLNIIITSEETNGNFLSNIIGNLPFNDQLEI